MKNIISFAVISAVIFLTFIPEFSRSFINREMNSNNTKTIHRIDTNSPSGIVDKQNNDRGVDSVEIRVLYSKGKLPVKRWVPDTLGIRLRKNIAGSFPIKVDVKIKNRLDSIIIYQTDFTILQSSIFDTLINLQLPKYFQVQYDVIVVEALPGKVAVDQTSILFFDSKEYCQDITIDEYNYADPCLDDDGGVGFDGVTGNLVAAFHNYDTTTFLLNEVEHCFFDTIGGGSQPYQIVIYDDDGTGKPGVLLHSSLPLISPPGTGSSVTVTYILPLTLPIPPNSRFYVGYKQTSVNNIAVCFQYEIPIRTRSFFYSAPETSVTWIDFAAGGNNFRLDVSPSSGSGRVNLSVIPQRFYNNVLEKLNMKDTVKLYLRQSVPPYALVDSSFRVIDSSTFSNVFSFNDSYTDSYYIVARHRNSVETWSSNLVYYVSGSSISQDFISSSSNAYGNNVTQVDNSPLRYGIYSGDVDQNGFVNLSDILLIFNKIIVFTSGYYAEDLTGDSIINLEDLVYCFNNTLNFIVKETP